LSYNEVKETVLVAQLTRIIFSQNIRKLVECCENRW